MSWVVGTDRHIGYGVPATCDYPGCGAKIDRGLGYACGGGVIGSVENCGLFFCYDHLHTWLDNDQGGGENVCERCAIGEPPFDPTPDVPEWIWQVLTDPSWKGWQESYPKWAAQMRRSLVIQGESA